MFFFCYFDFRYFDFHEFFDIFFRSYFFDRYFRRNKFVVADQKDRDSRSIDNSIENQIDKGDSQCRYQCQQKNYCSITMIENRTCFVVDQ